MFINVRKDRFPSQSQIQIQIQVYCISCVGFSYHSLYGLCFMILYCILWLPYGEMNKWMNEWISRRWIRYRQASVAHCSLLWAGMRNSAVVVCTLSFVAETQKATSSLHCYRATFMESSRQFSPVACIVKNASRPSSVHIFKKTILRWHRFHRLGYPWASFSSVIK